MSKIAIWVATSDTETKSLVRTSTGAILQELDPSKINASLKELTANLDVMLDGVKTNRQFQLNEFEIGLEITAEAGINLIGTMTVGGKAALTLKFAKVLDS